MRTLQIGAAHRILTSLYYSAALQKRYSVAAQDSLLTDWGGRSGCLHANSSIKSISVAASTVCRRDFSGCVGRISVHLSAAKRFLCGHCSAARNRRCYHGDSAGYLSLRCFARSKQRNSHWLAASVGCRDPRACAYQDGHATFRVEFAVRAYLNLAVRSRNTPCRMDGSARLACELRDSSRPNSCLHRCPQFRGALFTRIQMAESGADSEPHHASRKHERRRRWAQWPVLSEFCSGLWKPEDSQQVLHGIGFLQALPSGHLQPVVQFGTPLFVIQQSVVSKEH